MAQKLIFHIDVNSAFLSWTAAYRVRELAEPLDLRTVPSVICGSRDVRHGIVLAKSVPAKAYGVRTGEPLFLAKQKCPQLLVAQPDYGLYVEASRKFVAYLRTVAPVVEQYSIDEAWADLSGTQRLYGDPVALAHRIKDTIHETLGFTVNVGISTNKLLAKMAGELEKPDKVHTLFPEELAQKLWPLPVGELFLVGRSTEKKLRQMGIDTIGQLAACDPAFLRERLQKQGEVIWQSANGYNTESVLPFRQDNKGYSNSTTLPYDVTDRPAAEQVLLSLCETVGMRLRRDGLRGSCIAVQVRSDRFVDSCHQIQMDAATNVTQELYHMAKIAFSQLWRGQPLRQLGVQVTRLGRQPYRQFSLFTEKNYDQLEQLDICVDAIRDQFGEDAILRARFLKGELPHMAGGLARERRTGVTKEV